jgi:hypothetical protein
MEGYTVVGDWVTAPEWVSLPRPLDPLVLAMVVATGAAVGSVAWVHVVPAMRRRLVRGT